MLNRYAHNLGNQSQQAAQGAAPPKQEAEKPAEPSVFERAAQVHGFKPGVLKIFIGAAEIVERKATVRAESGDVVEGLSYFVVTTDADGVKAEKSLGERFDDEELAVLRLGDSQSQDAGYNPGHAARNRYAHNLPKGAK